MATAQMASFFELKITNDAGSPFTVYTSYSLQRAFQIIETSASNSGAANPVVVGKNGTTASDDFNNANSGGTPAVSLLALTGGGTPNFARASFTSADNINVSPASPNLIQLVFTCVDTGGGGILASTQS